MITIYIMLKILCLKCQPVQQQQQQIIVLKTLVNFLPIMPPLIRLKTDWFTCYMFIWSLMNHNIILWNGLYLQTVYHIFNNINYFLKHKWYYLMMLHRSNNSNNTKAGFKYHVNLFSKKMFVDIEKLIFYYLMGVHILSFNKTIFHCCCNPSAKK